MLKYRGAILWPVRVKRKRRRAVAKAKAADPGEVKIPSFLVAPINSI